MNSYTFSTQSCNKLEEEGFSFLAGCQFKTARLFFKEALNIDKSRHRSYWGLLLCEYQCKNENELYTKLAVPFAKEENYIKAIEFADADNRALYESILKTTLLTCHCKIVNSILEGDSYIAEKRIQIYDENCDENDELAKAHEQLKKAYCHLTPAICCYLFAIYSSLTVNTGKMCVNSFYTTRKKELKGTVLSLYSNLNNELLKTILSDPCNASDEDITLWCNPVKMLSEFCLPRALSFIGIDGNGDTVSKRYLKIIEFFRESKKTLSLTLTEKTLQLYKLAYENCSNKEEKSKINIEERLFCHFALNSTNEKEKLLDYLVTAKSSDSEYTWEYVVFHTNNFTLMPSYPEEDFDEPFKGTTSKSYTAYAKKEYCNYLSMRKYALISNYKHISEKLNSYAQTAIENATNKKDTLKKTWKEYISKVDETYNAILAETERQIEEAKNIADKCEKAAIVQSTKRGKFMLGISFFNILLYTGPVCAFGIFSLFNQEAIIKFPVILVYVAVLIIGIALTLIQYKISDELEYSDYSYHKYPKKINTALQAMKGISVVLSVSSLILIIISFIIFPSRHGYFEISSAQQMNYIANCPRADFVITKDINMKGEKFRTAYFFTGSLNGKNHTIKNLNAEGKVLFAVNFGTVNNLNFKKLRADNFCKSNRGTLNHLTFSSSTFASSVIKNDKDTVKNITLKDCIFNFESEASKKMAFVGSGDSKSERKTFKAESCTIKNLPMYVEASLGLYLRKKAGQDGEPIVLMKYKDKVLIQKTKGEWSYVLYNGQEGWCHNYYLTEEKI